MAGRRLTRDKSQHKNGCWCDKCHTKIKMPKTPTERFSVSPDTCWECGHCGEYCTVYRFDGKYRTIRHQCPDGNVPQPNRDPGEWHTLVSDDDFEDYRKRILDEVALD